METQTTQKQPWIKWLTIGFLGSLTIVGFFTTLWIWHFTPISINKNTGTVELGGNVTIHSDGDDVDVDVKDLKVENNKVLNGKVKVHTKGDKVTVDVHDMNIRNP